MTLIVHSSPGGGTVLDGYEMSLKGRAGLAPGVSLHSGAIGGLFGLLMPTLLSQPLAEVALVFRGPDLLGGIAAILGPSGGPRPFPSSFISAARRSSLDRLRGRLA